MTRKLLVALLAASGLLSGCDAMAYTLYVLFPSAREKEVEAECKELAGQSLAIVVYADRQTEFAYPGVRRSVAAVVMGELTQRLEGLRVIDPALVTRYQDNNIYWDETPKTDLGKAFMADYVLFLSLVEYSTREPGSLNLYRGRITAQAGLYKTLLPERKARVWSAREVRVRFPEHDPTGEPSESDRVIRETTERLFADKLAKKFYDHKVPIE
ncbi:MAG TPA: hypothetical protein VM695_13355 [Phycisphaerae bacterium]|nr:hypothetical protein [Phycisphaerae bacterium]